MSDGDAVDDGRDDISGFVCWKVSQRDDGSRQRNHRNAETICWKKGNKWKKL